MKKGWSIVLFSFLSLLLAFVMVMTFARFPVGTNKNYNSFLGAIELDHGVSSDAVFTYELTKDSDVPEDIDEVLSTLSYRLNKLGYEKHSLKAVQNVNADVYDVRIAINPDLDDTNNPNVDVLKQDVEAVMEYGELKFYGGSASNPTTEIFTGIDGEVATAKFHGYSGDGMYACGITFSEEAFAEIKEYMSEGAFYLKITLGDDDDVLMPFDGNSELQESYFTDSTIYVQSPTENGAKIIELKVQSGGLAYKFQYKDGEYLGQEMSSPMFGENVSEIMLIVIGSLIVVAMVAFIMINKGFGIANAFSLLWFILIEMLMLLAVPNVRLSIGSILGIILSTVLAIDGMAIITKRIKEEFASGKTYKSSIRLGFKRALLPIINTGLVSIIISLSIFFLVGGEASAFAITFGIGSFIAIIASLLFTRLYTAILLPLAKNKTAFLNLKREEE